MSLLMLYLVTSVFYGTTCTQNWAWVYLRHLIGKWKVMLFVRRLKLLDYFRLVIVLGKDER